MSTSGTTTRPASAPASGASPLRVALLGTPGVVLGVTGFTHPAVLSYDSSHHWWVMHLVALFIFPLVGVALAALVWPRRDPVAVVLCVGAYVYATAYTALDLIAGVTAGWITYRLGPDVERPDEVRYVFEIGNHLGTAGEIGLVVAALAAILVALRGAGAAALVGAVPLVVGVALHVEDHIYRPWGATGALLVGLGTAGLGWALGRGAQNKRDVGSSRPRSAS